MANFKVDENNNITRTSSSSKKGKATFSVSENGNIKRNKVEKKQKNGFFQGSKYFDDGYDFGDILKTTFWSGADLLQDVTRGFSRTIEGTTDTLGYLSADVLDFFGADDTADWLRDVSKYDVTGKLIKDSNYLEQRSVFGNYSDTVFEGVGNVGAMALTAGVTGGGVPSTVFSSFSSSYGNTMSEALRNGEDLSTARKAAFINGTSEAISEQFFSGLPGLKTENWGGKLLGKIGSGVERYFGTNTGKLAMKILNASGEGFEEIISNMLTSAGNDLMHKFDKNFTYGMEGQTGNILEDVKRAATSKESWNSFISAALTSALTNGGNQFISNTQKNKLIKSYAQENNMTVSQVKQAFNQSVQQKTQSEILKQPNMNLGQRVDVENLAKVQTMSELKRGTFVQPGTETQKYQYKETDNQKVNEMNKSLAEVGNNTQLNREAAATAERLIRDLGFEIEFTNNEKLQSQNQNFKGKNINGFVKDGKMYLNIDSNELANFTIGHETKHFFEANEELNNALNQSLKEYAQEKGIWDKRLAEVTDLYTDENGKLVGDPETELLADLTGEVFSNYEFVNNLSVKNPSLFEKVRDFFQKLYYKATGQREKLLIKNINDNLNRAYREYSKTQPRQEGTQYSLGTHYGDLGKARDTNFFAIDSSRRSTGHFGNGTYFVSQEESNRLNNDDNFTRKARPKNEVEFNDYNLYKPKIENEGFRLHDGLKAVNYGEYDSIDFKMMKDDLIRNGISEEQINNAINKVEELRKELKDADYKKQVEADSLSTEFMKALGFNGIDVRGLEGLDNTGYGSVIYDLDNKINSEKTLTKDSQGRELSEQQQEYFKDSKARDENGNLLTLYHGTYNDDMFTVFDPEKGFNIDAIYLTPDISVSSEFGNGSSIRNFDKTLVTRINNAKTVDDLINIFKNDLNTEYKIEKVGEDNYWLNKNDGLLNSPLGTKISDNVYSRKTFNGEVKEINIFEKLKSEALETAQETQIYGSNYELYANITNPLVIDAKGKSYHQIDFEGKIYNTETISSIAKERGYDGVIVKNVLETPYENKLTDDYIVFNSNQVKYVKNLNPTKNADIRYSLSVKEANTGVDSNGEKLSKEQQEYFANSKVIDNEGNLQPVYHMTNAEFNKIDFNKNYQGVFWFASNKQDLIDGTVSAVGTRDKANSKIMELYANIENPAGWKEYDNYGIGQLKEMGYDGVILKEDDGSFVGFVFNESNQIKDINNKKPTNNPDIRYSLSKDAVKDLAKELDESYSMLDANLVGNEDDVKRYLTKYTKLVDKYMKENNINIEPVMESTNLEEYSQKYKEFINNNNITVKKLGSNGKLLNEFLNISRNDMLQKGLPENIVDGAIKSIKDSFDLVDEKYDIPVSLKRFEKEFDLIKNNTKEIVNEYETKRKIEKEVVESKKFQKYLNNLVKPLFNKKTYTVDEVMEEAINNHGTTTNYPTAAYMTTDGDLLDFNDNGYRDDHRTIDVFDLDMNDFMNYGAIRLKPEGNGFEMATEPTTAQYEQLENYIDDYLKSNDDRIYIDISEMDNVGNELKSAGQDYPSSTPTSKIINDIKQYWETGKYPTQSKYLEFRYSLSNKDSQGRELSEQQQDYFKDSKVINKNGNLIEVYHGTPNDFTIFNTKDFGGKNGTAEGFGIYLTDNIEVADDYLQQDKGKVMKLYANITKPATTDNLTVTKQDIVKAIKELTYKEAQQMVADGDYNNINDALKDTWISNYTYTYDKSINDSYNDVAQTILDSSENDYEIMQELMNGSGNNDYTRANEFYNTITNTLGFDGIQTKWEFKDTDLQQKNANIWIAFNSNQVKNIDNINPTANEDIRYSISQEGELQSDKYKDLFPGMTRSNIHLSDLKRKEVELPTTEENALKTAENEQKQGEKPTRREVIDRNRELAREQLGDITKIKDKKRGFLYQINTMKRNLRDIMSKEQAQKMYDTYFKNITENNAKIENEINSYNERIQKYNLNDKESTYTQMIGELKHNPETTLTKEDVDNFYYKNANKIDQQKCEDAASEFRNIYDELIVKINDTLTDNGYKPIEYRKGYFPHFIEEKATSKLGKLAEKLGWKVQKGQLPTDIAGITDQFKPGKAWTSFSQQRTGDATDYNALKGLDNYLRGAMDIVYHTNDIQKLRALENEIRYQYSSKGIQEKIDNIYADDNLDMEEKNDAIANLTADMRGSGLGNFVTEIRNYTDNLANKKSFSDRSMEQAFGRDVYSIMNNINGRVSANMVGANISSAITNFIPITQAWGNMSTKNLLRGMYESIKTSIKGDNFADKSVFLTNRTKQADRLYNSKLEKINKKLGIPFEAIDSFTANTIVRGKYYDNIAKGMSEQEAIQNADEFAKDVMAGRSKGDQPTMFNKKNPLVKLFTAFQLEVNNQYGYMFKDIPTNLADEAKDKLVGAFIKIFLGAWLYNEITEKFTGRRAAFDPIDMAISDVKTLTDENMDLGDKIQSIVKDTSQELPFVSGVMGGGRLPIQGAIPYSSPLEMVTSTLEDIGKLDDPEKRKTAINNLKKEWSKPLYYVAMPFAGGQLKKTVEGLSMYDKDLPIAGSYTNSGKLRFEADTSALGKAQAAVFGQYASKNAREYFDEGYTPLTEKQINTVLDANMSVSDYRKYNKGLKEQKTTEDKVDYIYDLPISNDQKNVLVNSALNRKNNIDLSDYGNYGSLEEFDYSNKNPDKYLALTKITDYDTFQTYKNDLAEIKKEYDNTNDRKQAVFEYINSLPLSIEQKIMLQKMGAGYSIKQYRGRLHDYINNMDLTKEEKETIDKVLFD